MAQPWSTIAEDNETGALSYEMHIPLNVGETDGEYLIVWDESAVRQLHAQLEEFLTLVDQKRAMEEIIAQDAGGH